MILGSANSQYDAEFYKYQREGALRSARHTLPVLHSGLQIKSVLDVGCGAGAWLKAHGECGVEDLFGVDGDYVDRSLLFIDTSRFAPKDITLPLDLGRTYDLVECLEVAEHVPGPMGPSLIDNLVRHGKMVLFSAAVPGQGGKDHINERPLTYWRGLFAERGYSAFDPVRPKIAQDPEIEWWYRYNTLLYVHRDLIDSLPATVRATALPPEQKIPDFSSFPIRIQKFILQMLPTPVVSMIAALKHRLFIFQLKHG